MFIKRTRGQWTETNNFHVAILPSILSSKEQSVFLSCTNNSPFVDNLPQKTTLQLSR